MENKDNFLGRSTKSAIEGTLGAINNVIRTLDGFGLDILPEYRDTVFALLRFGEAAGQRMDELINRPNETFFGNLGDNGVKKLLMYSALLDAKDFAKEGYLVGAQDCYARFQKRKNECYLTEKEKRKLPALEREVSDCIMKIWKKQ